MPKPGKARCLRLPWLIRIDFPGMEVKDARYPQVLLRSAQCPARHAVRQQTEVPAAGRRQIAPKHPCRRERDFDEPRYRTERMTRRIRNAIEVMRDRVDARTIAVAFFGQSS